MTHIMEGMTQHLSAEMEFPLKLLLSHFTSTHFFLRSGMLYLFIIPHFLSFLADRISRLTRCNVLVHNRIYKGCYLGILWTVVWHSINLYFVSVLKHAINWILVTKDFRRACSWWKWHKNVEKANFRHVYLHLKP